MTIRSPASDGPNLLLDERRTLRDIVCDDLRRMIQEGSLAAGSRLVEEPLAASLGVSRNPVREAIRVLAAEGYVEILPRRGAVVASLTSEDVSQLFDVRAPLEGLAGRLAARNRTVAHLRAIDQILRSAQVAVDSGDRLSVAELNTAFHGAVLTAAANQYLTDLMVPLRGQLHRVFVESFEGGRAHQSLSEHRQLAAAVADQDVDRAEQLGHDHVLGARRWFESVRGTTPSRTTDPSRPDGAGSSRSSVEVS
jgi:DNA-binding GntR family transcriptional regulator